MITNKEKEMWELINKLENENLIKIKDWNILNEKIADALMRKQGQIDEAKESRDNWKGKYLTLKEKK